MHEREQDVLIRSLFLTAFCYCNIRIIRADDGIFVPRRFFSSLQFPGESQ